MPFLYFLFLSQYLACKCRVIDERFFYKRKPRFCENSDGIILREEKCSVQACLLCGKKHSVPKIVSFTDKYIENKKENLKEMRVLYMIAKKDGYL